MFELVSYKITKRSKSADRASVGRAFGLVVWLPVPPILGHASKCPWTKLNPWRFNCGCPSTRIFPNGINKPSVLFYFLSREFDFRAEQPRCLNQPVKFVTKALWISFLSRQRNTNNTLCLRCTTFLTLNLILKCIPHSREYDTRHMSVSRLLW